MASELKLDMRSDGFVKDNKQRFNLLEENGELLIRANHGHTLTTVETESLLKPILSHEEVPAWDLQEKLGINSTVWPEVHEKITYMCISLVACQQMEKLLVV
ncbi:hypothetical protein ACS0TY_003626 [Phlomoides rotata]